MLNAVFNRRFKFVSLNANGLRQPSKRRALFKELRTQNADLYLLQETHSTTADQKIRAAEWGGKVFFSHGRSNSKGVAVLLNRNLDVPVTVLHSDDNGRLLIIQLAIQGELIAIANLYAPTQSNPREQIDFIIECEEALAELEIQTLFLAGDLNTSISISKDPTDLSTNGAAYRTHIRSIMEDYSLMDIWKKQNPRSNRGTFHRGSYSARLDYWLIPEHLQNPATSTNIIPLALSDHSMITLEVGVTMNERGPGHWRFDNSLLQDPAFKEKMLQHIRISKEEELSDPNL